MKIKIDMLQPTEIALPKESVQWIEKNYKSRGEEFFEEIKVIPWNGRYAIINGNKRTYVFYMNGATEIEAICEEFNASSLRHATTIESAEDYYKKGINHIKDLEGKIHPWDEYEDICFESADF